MPGVAVSTCMAGWVGVVVVLQPLTNYCVTRELQPGSYTERICSYAGYTPMRLAAGPAEEDTAGSGSGPATSSSSNSNESANETSTDESATSSTGPRPGAGPWVRTSAWIHYFYSFVMTGEAGLRTDDGVGHVSSPGVGAPHPAPRGSEARGSSKETVTDTGGGTFSWGCDFLRIGAWLGQGTSLIASSVSCGGHSTNSESAYGALSNGTESR